MLSYNRRKTQLSAMRKEYLIEKLLDAEDTISRKESTLADNMDRMSELRGKLRHDERIVVAKRKRKGQMDRMAWKKWSEFAKLQIMINLLAGIPSIMAAHASEEFTWFLVVQTGANAVIGPAIFFYQKKQEQFG